MELINSLSSKFNVSERMLESCLVVRPTINYTNAELVKLCEEHRMVVALPEKNNDVYLLLAADRLRNVGKDMINYFYFKRLCTFPEAELLWRHYSDNLFTGLQVRRLYINNMRVDYQDVEAEGRTIRFTIEGAYPVQSNYNHMDSLSIFINGTLYNTYKVSILSGGLVFIWTTP